MNDPGSNSLSPMTGDTSGSALAQKNQNDGGGSSSARKSVKGNAVSNLNEQRRIREGKAVQLRKERRVQRVDVQRRRMQGDESAIEALVDEESSSVAGVSPMEDGSTAATAATTTPAHNSGLSMHRIRIIEAIPRKTALLLSSDPAQQIEGAVYFRRILAIDRSPPIDEVLAQQQVVPALMSFLSRWELPQLQVEAAWCITNIACGETRHVAHLLQHQAIETLLGVLHSSATAIATTVRGGCAVSAAADSGAALRDQVLWALSNLTVDEAAGRRFLALLDSLLPLLREIGLHVHTTEVAVTNQCGGNNNNISISSSSSGPAATATTRWSRESIVQYFATAVNPSLCAMRYVAFICGNLIRLKASFATSDYARIIFALNELVHSPDEEILLDICSSYCTICREHPQCVPLLAEHGLVSRMKECLKEFHPPPTAAAGGDGNSSNSSNNNQASAHMSGFNSYSNGNANDNSHSNGYSNNGISTSNATNSASSSSSSSSVVSVYEMALLVLSALLAVDAIPPQHPALLSITLEAIQRTVLLSKSFPLSSATTTAGNSSSSGSGGNGSSNISSKRAGNAQISVLQHMILYLRRPQCFDSTRVDICRALQRVLSLQLQSSQRSQLAIASECCSSSSGGLLDSCSAVLQFGSHDAATAAGKCACQLLQNITHLQCTAAIVDDRGGTHGAGSLLHSGLINPLQVLSLLVTLTGATDAALVRSTLYFANFLVRELHSAITQHQQQQQQQQQYNYYQQQLDPRVYQSLLESLSGRVDALLSHPEREIAALSAQLEDAVDNFSSLIM